MGVLWVVSGALGTSWACLGGVFLGRLGESLGHLGGSLGLFGMPLRRLWGKAEKHPKNIKTMD